MANYVRNGYRAIPECHTKRTEKGFATTVRIYRYPGELVQIEEQTFEKETKEKAQQSAQAWLNEVMQSRYRG
jgi:O-succinylbenzoate synthase